jgi:hypothetical protein
MNAKNQDHKGVIKELTGPEKQKNLKLWARMPETKTNFKED